MSSASSTEHGLDALILFIQTLALYKSFTYSLTYLDSILYTAWQMRGTKKQFGATIRVGN